MPLPTLFLRSLVLCLFVALAAQASAEEPTLSQSPRPKIGLVLGGGGAKGAAHIGVLKILEAHRVPVDYVAGTSMGAIVGSMYAAGYSAAEIDEMARRIDWISLFKDRSSRAKVNFRRKQQDEDLLSDFRASFQDGKLILPQGIIQGQKLYLTLSRELRKARLIHDFDYLPIPFRAIATDLETGQAVVMKNGDLVDAVFASMAVPGLVPPVTIGDQLLVDGGVANNLPVDVAKAMGADIVIVVDISADAKSKEEITNVIDVMRQLTILMGAEATAHQRAALTSKDVHIRPNMGEISMMSFDRVTDAIARGQTAAAAQADTLSALSISEEDWALYLSEKARRTPDEPVIEFVEVNQNSDLGDETVKGFINTQVGSSLSLPQLRSDIDTLYGLDTFARVSYRMITDERGTGLSLTADQNPAKKSYLGLGLALETDFNADTSFQLGAGFTVRNLNDWGGEWRTLAQVGSNLELVTDFYQPLGRSLNFFVNPSIAAVRNRQLIFAGQERPTGEVRVSAVELGLDMGFLLGNWGAVTVGQRKSWGDIRPLVGEFSDFEGGNFSDSYAFARLEVDTLDDLSFPRDGVLVAASITDHKGPLGGDFDFSEFSFVGYWVNSWDDNTLVLGGRMQTTLNSDESELGGFSLGGFLSLSGLAEDQISGRHTLLAQSIYYHRLTRESLFLSMPIYVGGSLEFGNVYNQWSDLTLRSMELAGSLFIGFDTPIGPIFFGGGATESGDTSLYLQMGQTF